MGKWPTEATVQSLVEAGHLSATVIARSGWIERSNGSNCHAVFTLPQCGVDVGKLIQGASLRAKLSLSPCTKSGLAHSVCT